MFFFSFFLFQLLPYLIFPINEIYTNNFYDMFSNLCSLFLHLSNWFDEITKISSTRSFPSHFTFRDNRFSALSVSICLTLHLSMKMSQSEKAYFALACFWKPDAQFGCCKGVTRTRVGYAGGTGPAPNYPSV